jgi:hypothetical protein
MVVCLLRGVRAWYRMEPFAAEEPVLGLLFPQYDAKAWHDAHLGDTLDAIWAFGPGALQGAVTAHLLHACDIQVAQIHDESHLVQGLWPIRDEGRDLGRTGHGGRGPASGASRSPSARAPGAGA